MQKAKKTKTRQPADYRLQGIAAALAEIADAHLERDLARMVLESLEVTVKDLQLAGADAYDLERITGEAE